MDNVLRTTASGQVLDRMPMTDRGSKGSRLGVYVDDVYHLETANRERLSTDRAFLLFVCEVGRRFDRLVLFGRTLRSDRSADYVLPSGIGLAELPHYSNLADVREVLRSAIGTVRGMWRGLSRVDTVWIFGPHPFALLLVALATLRRRRIVLGVRQDTVAYHRARLPSGRWSPLLIPVLVMDRAYRTLSRFFPATAVGPEVARRYGLPRSSLLTMTASLVRASDIGMPAKRDWSGRVRLVTVGRLEPEKNPALLVRALARLERDHPGSFELMWLGRGRLEAQVRRLADELHVADQLEVRGYIPFGPDLLELYRSAHLFVHVSLTEGVPQVLIEAQAVGTPIVATDVGGVRSVLDNGNAGLLVQPEDLGGLVAAVLSLRNDEGLRQRLIARGLELARERTLEVETDRVARFLATGSVE
jgi:glycosyltransferase involved in cell wall biosynthesis